MRFRPLNSFDRGVSRLSPEGKEAVRKALSLLGQDPRHNSLNLEKVPGQPHRWVARASRGIRFSFDWEGDLITLRVVGHHDDIWRAP